MKNKSKHHPNNKHQGHYNFDELISALPELKPFVVKNKRDESSINFFDPAAVKALNKALLMSQYGIKYWDIPEGYLCPPVPGRADYVHHLAGFLAELNNDKIPKGKSFRCLDIGMGANMIYPIIAQGAYRWSFVGTDIDTVAVDNARKIVAENTHLKGTEIRLQEDATAILSNMIKKDEYFDCCICNPPFHKSEADARAATMRKLKNLKNTAQPKFERNFGGQGQELWCNGGELAFITKMIEESSQLRTQFLVFSTLVSNQNHLDVLEDRLESIQATATKIIPISHGQKKSHVLIWSFLSPRQQEKWVKLRW